MTFKRQKELELNEVSDVMRVHPRTVLRALENDVNAYWAEGYNPIVKIEKLLKPFDMDYIVFHRVLKQQDEFLKPKEASKYLNLAHRTFVYRKYNAAIRRGGIVRFSKYEIINENLDKHINL